MSTSDMNRQVGEERCRRKTAKGNFYGRRYEAFVAAKIMSRQKNQPIQFYRCFVCRKYHLGRDRTDAEKAFRMRVARRELKQRRA